MEAGSSTTREVALDALGRVVTACCSGMRALPELLEDRGSATQETLRERIVPLLGAHAAAQRLAFEERDALRSALPFEAQADVGLEYLQGLDEGLALLGNDGADPLIPDAEDVARWTADPQVLLWLQRTSRAVPADVLAWADGAQEALRPEPVDRARAAAVGQAARGELVEQAGGYRAVVDAYGKSRTRAVAVEGAWGRLVALARVLRTLKGPSCRLSPFFPDGGSSLHAAFSALHQVFASLALIVAGEHPAGLLIAPEAVDAACVS